MAGVEKVAYSPDLLPMRVPCTGLIDPALVIKCFEEGADGVIISACKPSDLRHAKPSKATVERVKAIGYLLEAIGIEKDRVRMVWISAPEGVKFADEVNRHVSEIEKMGPLKLEVKA